MGELWVPPREMIYEVFRQEREGQPFQHGGSLEAPDSCFAELYAREFYARRNESSSLWIVPRESIHEVSEFVDEFERNYRRVDGYSIKVRLNEARIAAENAAHFPREGFDPSLRSGESG